MSEDRAFKEPEQVIARLSADLEDFKSTMLARVAALPTGTMLPTLASVPPVGTLLLQGQVVSRTTYARLWQWVQDTAAAGFGVGDGSTTFTLPDARDRALVGASATIPLGSVGGAATRTLTASNLPAHGHTGTAASAGTHNHDSTNGQLDNNGGHSGHFPGSQFIAAAGADLGLAAWNSGGGTRGDHGHFFTFDITSGGAHTHTVTINNTGSGEAFDNRPPYLGVNVAVWT